MERATVSAWALGLHARGNAMLGQAAGDDPGFIAPMLATAAAGLPPDADKFVAEVKLTACACIAVADGRVRAWSCSGRDITAVYPELGALAEVARRRSLVLDGEIVALAGPRPDFTVLQRRMRASRSGAAKGPASCRQPTGQTLAVTA